MATIRDLTWAAISAAVFLPAAALAQTGYPQNYEPSTAPAPPAETMIPYASSPPAEGQPNYSRQDGYGQPGDGQSGYGPNADDRPGPGDPSARRHDDGGYSPGMRADQGYGDDRPPDDRDRRASDDQERYGDPGGYSRLRGIEQHIRGAIADGVRDDALEPEDARDLLDQLRRIQRQESSEYRTHGDTLPQDDEQQLSDQLRELDRRVDDVRRER